MRRVKVCLLGCGEAARTHSKIVRSLGGVDLMYASRTSARATAYSRRYRGVGTFDSYTDACADPAIDAVIVCTPPALHADLACLALSSGKAVLIEKPVTRTLAELARIEAAAEQSGGMAMVAENYYFKPAVVALRREIAAGNIGTVLSVELNRTGGRKATGWRADEVLTGGDPLLEGGVHWINVLSRLGGPIRDLVATRLHSPDAGDAASARGIQLEARFKDGAVGTLLYGWGVPNRLGGLGLSRIHGTLGSIQFESNGLFALVSGRRTRVILPGVRDLMGSRAMLGHFIDCLRDGRQPEMSLADGRADLTAVLTAYRSMASGKREALVSEG